MAIHTAIHSPGADSRAIHPDLVPGSDRERVVSAAHEQHERERGVERVVPWWERDRCALTTPRGVIGRRGGLAKKPSPALPAALLNRPL